MAMIIRAVGGGLLAFGAALCLGNVVLGADLNAGATFQDCDECPEMVVIIPGQFIMGSPDTEPERDADESPRHGVTIRAPFAFCRFPV